MTRFVTALVAVALAAGLPLAASAAPPTAPAPDATSSALAANGAAAFLLEQAHETNDQH